ncbi:VWFA and cache domain-containing protein CG16868 [Episyrphus balteatus]|uniref:VWFA and cache domain-containing protein CG16868 n=1 Tax=Episyrphus balteatus TaxID=286459 RepID=UPI0024862D39|nr:VWFA and cache domain-containing protein CG16868 [Episyrphus balteatus]
MSIIHHNHQQYMNYNNQYYFNSRHRRRQLQVIVIICAIGLLQQLHIVVGNKDKLNINNSYVPILISTTAESETTSSEIVSPIALLQHHRTTSSNNDNDQKKSNSNSSISSSSSSHSSKYIVSASSIDKTQVPLVKNSTVNVLGSSQLKPTNYSVMTLVRSIDARLKTIRNIELGITTIQEIFDAMDFKAIISETNNTLHKFSNRLTKKLQKATTIIYDFKWFFENNITQIIDSTIITNRNSESESNQTKPLRDQIFLNTLIQPCPFEDYSLEQNYNKQQIQILNYLKNNHHDNLVIENNLSFKLNGKILEEIRRLNNQDAANNYKHIYYLSNYDYASDHNCQYYFNNLHFRRLYVATIVEKKRVFILIDVGSVLSVEQMELSKSFVSNLVQMLTDTDFISIVTISDEAIPMELTNFRQNPYKLTYLATPDKKEEILDYISMLKRSTEPTNHSLGFEYSFSLLRQQNLSENEPLEFIYVTRGLLTRLSDARSVLAAIALGQQMLPFPITINTCAVILDEKRIMYEKQFLNDIVHQNYTKYDIDVSSWHTNNYHHNLTGNLYIITKRHPERIIKISTAVFSDLFYRYGRSSDKLQLHQPVVDYNAKDGIVSITHGIKEFGVIGVNLYLSDLAEDVMNFKNSANSYACLIDINGIAIIHPALQQVPYLTKASLSVDIALLENTIDFQSFRKILLREKEGNVTLSVMEEANSKDVTKTYLWHRVMDMLIVCIVTTKSKNTNNVNGKPFVPQYQTKYGNVGWQKFQHIEYMAPFDLLYHRIDLISPHTPVCRYFRQIATLDSVTLFLSASAFQSPFTYLKNNRLNCDKTKIRTVQSIMAYIKDNTGLLVNPGLLPRIRNDVSALYSVMEHLRKRHLKNGEFKNYIIRRYAATISGVLQVYPGCLLATDFDPLRRPWFLKAVQHPGRIVVTQPYLDAGGAGYIITIAHTVFEGKANALHNSERDSPVAVIALDVPYAFFYKIILDTPLCLENNIKCILFENEGYLIAHPSMMEAVTATNNLRRPHEHLTHKESFLANDILNHKILVKKLACANYQNRNLQRYYTFNTSLTEVLTNVVHGERTKYKITAVWGTNIFAAVLNSTCDGGAFCPCSTVDRICLNCNRMDQTDCECPCECPMHITKATTSDDDNNNEDDDDDSSDEYELLRSYTLRYPYCEPLSDTQLALDNSSSYDWNMVLNSCLHINCDVYVTHFDCLAVMGCEWCQLDLDGNAFSASFCTMQNSCFNGVLNSLTPYGDGELGSAIIEPPKSQPYSAFGPVGGAIIVLCLIIGFAMYCYRQSLENGVDQFYVDSMHEDNYGVPLSRFNFDNISPPDNGDMDDLGDGHGGALNRNLVHPIGNAIAVSDISPYHMSTGSSYRRPPNGESDHGYSTMTPHEDSEHMCFTLAEPLINNKRLSKSDSLSISTSVSSPTNHNNGITVERPVSSMGIRIRSNDHRNTPKNNSIFGQTELGDCNKETENHQQQQMSPHHILARVTVHRHMEAL